jgi:hypothetical protein
MALAMWAPGQAIANQHSMAQSAGLSLAFQVEQFTDRPVEVLLYWTRCRAEPKAHRTCQYRLKFGREVRCRAFARVWPNRWRFDTARGGCPRRYLPT